MGEEPIPGSQNSALASVSTLTKATSTAKPPTIHLLSGKDDALTNALVATQKEVEQAVNQVDGPSKSKKILIAQNLLKAKKAKAANAKKMAALKLGMQEDSLKNDYKNVKSSLALLKSVLSKKH